MDEEEMITELSAMAEWNNFAASLVMQYRSKGDLSQKQWDAAERTILNVQAKAEKRCHAPWMCRGSKTCSKQPR